MNKHFHDAWYYLGRAVDHLRIGLDEELTPFVQALREQFGGEETSEEPQTRLGRVKETVQNVDTEPVRKARERFGSYRTRPPVE